MERVAMERVAALFFPALPLQMVVQTEPALKARALAVLQDHRVAFVNKKAHRLGIRPRMADHQALRLVSDLQIRTVDPAVLERRLDQFSRRLTRYSPAAEPQRDRPGLFLLDARGLTGLWNSASDWAQDLLSDLEAEGWSLRLVLGHHRFTVTSLVLASRNRLLLYDDFSQEAEACRQLPLSSFSLPDTTLFDRLGLSRLADLLALPRSQAAMRFSEATVELLTQATLALAGAAPTSLSAPPEDSEPQADLDIENVLLDAESLVFLVKRALHQLMADLQSQRKAVTSLVLILDPAENEPNAQKTESKDSENDATHPLRLEVRPASPTRNLSVLLELLRLKLETIRLDAPPSGIRLELHTDHHESRQLRLFTPTITGNIARANRELARLRAQLPHGSLVTGRITPAHMPEHRAEWTVFDRMPQPDPAPEPKPVVVRRRLDKPRVLARRPQGRLRGPFLVTGGWWTGKTLRRKYYYVEQEDGRILWIAYDPDAERFLLWGDVE